MRVKNLNGAPQNECSSGSWLAHWEKFSGQTAYRCFVIGCKNKRSVGGHVQKDSLTDKNWYIVPLCDACNKKTGQDLDIWDLATLVSTSVTKPSRVVPDTSPIRAHRTASSLS